MSGLRLETPLATLTNVGLFSSMNDRRPVKIVDTDQAGFHVSGW
jgi:hypothetical protein